MTTRDTVRPVVVGSSVLSISAGVVHLAASGDHYGLTATLMSGWGVAQVAVGLVVILWGTRLSLVASALVNAGAVIAWLASRTVGVPLLGVGREAVGTQDLICAALGLGAVLTAVAAIAAPDRAWPWNGWGAGALIIGATLIAVFSPGHGMVDQSVPILEAGRISDRLPGAEAVALLGLSARPVLAGTGAHSHSGPGHGNGFQQPPPPAPLNAAEQGVFDEQWAAAANAAREVATLEQAEAAGYRQASLDAPGIGAHWVKWSLVDQPFDPGRPSMLLFRNRRYGEPPELVGLSYWVASAVEPEGFAGPNDHWHSHQGMCFVDGWLRYERVERREDCEDTWIEASDLWMLHAWPVPSVPNRWGLFADTNPALCSTPRNTPDINRCDPNGL